MTQITEIQSCWTKRIILVIQKLAIITKMLAQVIFEFYGIFIPTTPLRLLQCPNAFSHYNPFYILSSETVLITPLGVVDA